MYDTYQKLLDKYGLKNSDISRATGISNMTLSDWKRGVSTPKQDKMKKIADYFGVTVDYLMTGKEEPKTDSNLTSRDQKEITKILDNTEQLLRQDGLMFDGNPASQEEIDSIISAMKIGMGLAKQKNKEKYTPKKYKKD